MYFIYGGQVVFYTEELSWAWILLRRPDNGWGQGLWHKLVHLPVTRHLGVGISGRTWLETFLFRLVVG